MERVYLKVLCDRRIVRVSVPVLKRVARILPIRAIHLFVGRLVSYDLVPSPPQVRIALPGGEAITMFGSHDPIATMIGWRGIEVYEPEVMDLLGGLMAANPGAFIDVGANTGLYVLAAATLDPGRTVVALEPHPRVFRRLEENVRLNRVESTTLLVPAAAAASPGIVGLATRGEALPIDGSFLSDPQADGEVVQVRATTLDQVVVAEDPGEVGVILLDIEGAEPEALRGARNILKRHRPSIVCEVLGPGPELDQIVRSVGYRPFWIGPNGLEERALIVGDPERLFRNYLFLPSERADAIFIAMRTGAAGR